MIYSCHNCGCLFSDTLDPIAGKMCLCGRRQETDHEKVFRLEYENSELSCNCDGMHNAIYGDGGFVELLAAKTKEICALKQRVAFLTRTIGWLENSSPLAFWRGYKADGTPMFGIRGMDGDGMEVIVETIGEGRDLCSAVEDAIAREKTSP